MRGFPQDTNYAEFDQYSKLDRVHDSDSDDSSDENEVADPLTLEDLGPEYKDIVACDDCNFDECIMLAEEFVVDAATYPKRYHYLPIPRYEIKPQTHSGGLHADTDSSACSAEEERAGNHTHRYRDQ